MLLALPLLTLLFTLPGAVGTQQTAKPDAFDNWKIVDRGGHVMNYMGRPSLFLNNGIAFLPGSDFGDGSIEFDVAIHGQTGFAGVVFRGASPDNYELIYLRTHRSRQWDALQYTPVTNAQEAWQLYAGEGYNGVAELPANRWLHVKVDVDGYTARVFVDRATTPQLVVTDLKRPWARGFIGLWGRFGAANFSQVTVTPAGRASTPARSRPAAAPPVITKWSLSPAFDAAKVSADRRIEDQIPNVQWSDVEAEPSGILNIAEHRELPDADRGLVFARTRLRSETPRRVKLRFGYSDQVTIQLNGQPVFSGTAGYLQRDGSALGTVTRHDAVYLDLKAGDNEIVFAVSEQFGGWGLSAEFAQ